MVSRAPALGAQFARAVAAKDFARVRELLQVDFRGMTPNRSWEATGPDEVVDDVLARWFESSDEIEAVDRLECEAFADRRHLVRPA